MPRHLRAIFCLFTSGDSLLDTANFYLGAYINQGCIDRLHLIQKGSLELLRFLFNDLSSFR